MQNGDAIGKIKGQSVTGVGAIVLAREDSRTRSSFIRRLSDSDELAWQQFYGIYHPKLMRWSRGYGLKSEDAEDLISELIQSLWHRLQDFRYDRDRSFHAYLRTMLRNLAIKHTTRRRSMRMFSLEDDDDATIAGAADSILDHLCDVELQTLRVVIVGKVLKAADTRDRKIWVELYDSTATADELAKRFEISRATVFRIRSAVNEKIRSKERDVMADDCGPS